MQLIWMILVVLIMNFFNLSDAESRLIDPKQRLLLMTAYRAFEDAGVLEELSNTHTGVFIGNSNMLNYNTLIS